MPECLQFYMKNKDTLFFSHPFETSLINTLLVLHTNLCKKTTWYDFQGNCEFQKSLCNKKLMKFISINQYMGRHHYYQNQKTERNKTTISVWVVIIFFGITHLQFAGLISSLDSFNF